jgi:hypothetical protein
MILHGEIAGQAEGPLRLRPSSAIDNDWRLAVKGAIRRSRLLVIPSALAYKVQKQAITSSSLTSTKAKGRAVSF